MSILNILLSLSNYYEYITNFLTKSDNNNFPYYHFVRKIIIRNQIYF